MGNLINLGTEIVATIPNGNGYKFQLNSSIYTKLTQILSVTGSGFLKSAFIANASAPSSAYYSQIKITIDGNIVLNLNNTTNELGNSYAQGITDNINYSGSNALLPLVEGNIVGINIASSTNRVGSIPIIFPSTIEKPLDAAGALLIIPELVRFEDSLVVEVKKESDMVKSVCEYYLD